MLIGVDRCINYKSHDFVEEILRDSHGAGVDVVEDFIGADYLMRNMTLLRENGRLALVSDLGGTRADIDITGLRRKRLSIFGFTLRAQTIESKRQVVQRFRDSWLQKIAKKKAIRPVVHSTFPLAEAGKAHGLMEANGHFGKIVLTLD
jgi:NADPH2:quinone reductase